MMMKKWKIRPPLPLTVPIKIYTAVDIYQLTIYFSVVTSYNIICPEYQSLKFQCFCIRREWGRKVWIENTITYGLSLTVMQETWVQSLVGNIPGECNGNPLQYSCLENSMDRGAWWARVHTVRHDLTSQIWLSDFHFTLSLYTMRDLNPYPPVVECYIQNSNMRKWHQMQKQKENELKELQMVISWNW